MLVSALRRQRQVGLCEPAPQSEFQTSHGYVERLLSKKRKKKKTNKQKNKNKIKTNKTG